jgi:hypothetical protein
MCDPIRAEVIGAVTVITFPDRRLIDEAGIEGIQAALLRLVEAGHRNLLYDLGDVEWLSSRMLAVMLGLRRRIAASLPSGRQAAPLVPDVVPPPGVDPGSDPPQRSRVFEVYPDRRSALRVLAEAGPGHGWVAICSARPEVSDLFRVC